MSDDRGRATGVESGRAIVVHVDDREVVGASGQTIAGVIIAAGDLALRRTSRVGAPRGIFCGIGVCFDCLVTVNGLRDVRACQRRAHDGDIVATQHDERPPAPSYRSADAAGDSGDADV